MQLQIYDCTLREGEQAAGASPTLEDRKKIFQALDNAGIHLIEIGWPLHKPVMELLSQLEENQKQKAVAFGSTSMTENTKEDPNLNAIIHSKVKYATLVGKSWLEHVIKQLKITEQENLKRIRESIELLKQNNITVFYDAEHYFDAFKSNKNYALETLKQAEKAGSSVIILCDTNGGSLPEEIHEIVKQTKEQIKTPLGIHCHNDSGLALANTLKALPFVTQIQVTTNGLGERVGNTDLCEIVPLLVLKKQKQLNIELPNIKLNHLPQLSKLVYNSFNLPQQIRQPFVSPRAFSHKAGIHIDATLKGASYEHISPQELGLEHEIILSSIGGGACITNTAKKFNYPLNKKDPETRKKINALLKELEGIEKKGYDLGNLEAEQFLLIERFFGKPKEFFAINNWKISTEKDTSRCKIEGTVNGLIIEKRKKIHGGPIDAAFKAIQELVAKKYPEINNLALTDYKVRIAKPKTEGVESTVRTRIEFTSNKTDKSEKNKKFTTVGISENIIESGIEAIQKAFRYYLMQAEK